MTVVGELTQERSSYYCEDCHHGFFPREEVLGLGQELFSPGIRRMVAFTAASLSFQESKTLFLMSVRAASRNKTQLAGK